MYLIARAFHVAINKGLRPSTFSTSHLLRLRLEVRVLERSWSCRHHIRIFESLSKREPWSPKTMSATSGGFVIDRRMREMDARGRRRDGENCNELVWLKDIGKKMKD